MLGAWGQTLYRYGSSFPVVTVKGATREQLREWAREWGPLTAQTSLFKKSDKQEIEFKGLEGRALDPEPYYSTIMERISAGSGIPKPMIIGAQAGQLAGSEVNEREYFKLISDCQSRYEPMIMSLIDDLMKMRQIPDVHYRIKWLGGFEINPVQGLLDYPLAFAALGLAGLFKRHALIGVGVGITGRFIASFLSGILFFLHLSLWKGQ